MYSEITSVKIEDSEIQFEFIRASGPGGQNVNKVASAVQLRFNVRTSPSLETDVKERLIKLAGHRITEDGILIIEAKRFRTQEANRLDALRRLNHLLEQASHQPKTRRPTRKTGASHTARLKSKNIRSQLKKRRSVSAEDWEE